MKKFFKEFKDFAMRGNVLDMAVGVVIGGAFGKITTSLVNDIIMPFVSMLTGGIDFSQLFSQIAGIQHKTVGNRIIQVAGMAISGGSRYSHLALQRMDNTNFSRQVHALVQIQSPGMRYHEIVLNLDGLLNLEGFIRGKIPCQIAILSNGPRFVKGSPFRHPIAEGLKTDFGVFHKFVNQIAIQPMAILKKF